ncbi:MAG TPA: hypothetical protein GX002_04500 [Clostridiales bacterium]|nr:hypothetical protein [Clostridiales bacterium]
MKDKFRRIHIFEVKSVNQSAGFSFDNNIYIAKVAELKNVINKLASNGSYVIPTYYER